MGLLTRTLVCVLLAACEAPAPAVELPAGPRCPERMALVEATSTCIDRYEAVVREGRALPAEGAIPTDTIAWSAARSACRSAGFRLCRREEWMAACSGPLGRSFPYGSEHVLRRCNDAVFDAPAGSIERGGQRAGCVTPEGVFDLVGNVSEWLEDEGPGGGIRETIGGSFGTMVSHARCDYAHPQHQPETAAWSALGFRCCADAR